MTDKNAQTTEAKIRLDRRKREKRRKIKAAIIWIVILAIIIYAASIYRFYKANSRFPWQPAVATAAVMPVEATVQQKSYQVAVDISGYVEAYQTQEAKFRSSGTITSVKVAEGDRVEKGQLLVTMDDTDVQYSIESTRNAMEEARIDGNASQLRLLQMKLDSQLEMLENTKVYANFAGVVTSVDVQENDYFAAGTSAVTVIDNSKLKATVEIDEIDMRSINLGMEASVTADSAPGQTLKAKVTYIPMVGRYSSSGIGVMDVEITFEDFPETFKPGFSFEGVIDVEEPQTMLLVPQNAVKTSRGISTVDKKLADGTVKTIEVAVKYLGEGYYQILSGDLADGDTVMMQASTDSLSSMMGGFMIGGGEAQDAPSGSDMPRDQAPSRGGTR
ncbi:MAG: efflux RND transporter periplasmic adaptor subunit [Sphaerochaetaceae bacterium]